MKWDLEAENVPRKIKYIVQGQQNPLGARPALEQAFCFYNYFFQVILLGYLFIYFHLQHYKGRMVQFVIFLHYGKWKEIKTFESFNMCDNF